MKTTTVRLEDVWADMVDHKARKEGRKPSDVLRDAVRYYMIDCAETEPDLAEMKESARKAALREGEDKVLKKFGETPQGAWD